MEVVTKMFDLSKKLTLMLLLYCVILSICSIGTIHCRVHDLDLEDDDRKGIHLTAFGYLKGGTLMMNVTKFSFKKPKDVVLTKNAFGFTIDVSASSGVSGYVEGNQEKCIFEKRETEEDNFIKDNSIVFFRMDTEKRKVLIEREGKLVNLTIIPMDDRGNSPHTIKRRQSDLTNTKHDVMSDSYLLPNIRRKRQDEDVKSTPGVTVSKPKDKAVTVAPDVEKKKEEEGKSKETDVDDETKKEGDSGVKTVQPVVGAVAGTVTTEKTAKPQSGIKNSDKPSPLVTELNMERTVEKDGSEVFSMQFQMMISTEEEEGLYNLYFHNCLQYQTLESTISLSVILVEDNNGNYLSAGEMPLPTLFFCLSILFFIIGCVWLTVLRRCKEDVYKIHYLMLVVVFVKSLSCLFHGVNSHFIQKEGIHEEAWAVLYYIVYLTRGALLFITILLIGAGWAFVKHVFSDKEKKLFLIIIPLQILDNIAWLILEESEEGMSRYTTWKQIFVLVDLLCCGAILFPVVWSIRHLQEAAHTDGKAAISLNKLKLFRQFYILIVCYIYFTRIIVYLLRITVPFKFVWLDQLFRELATFVFFVVTGYKFRPAEDNPYLQVPQEEDEDVEMDEVLTKPGALDSVVRVNKAYNDNEAKLTKVNTNKQQESSHVYD